MNLSEEYENETNEILGEVEAEVKTQVLDEDIKGFTEITTEDLASMFGDYILYNQNEFQKQLKTEDFNYNVFGSDYYAEKFPHFSPEVHDILAKVSQEKIIDLRKQKEFFKPKEEIGEIRPFA